MLQQLRNLRVYIIYVLGILGIYTWTGTRGISYYGDDNNHKKDKNQRMGGHGTYYHK